jgi:small subunit ribosomal protein S6
MPLYEHVFLARQDVTPAQVDTLIKEYQGVIEEGGGKIVRHENAGLKNISYKIKKNRKAHYALLNIDAPPAAVAEMERRMRIATDIIRFLTVRVEEHEAEPTALVRKSDREERGPRGGGGRFGDREGGGGGPRGGGGRFGDRPPRDGAPREDRGDRPPRPFGDRPPRPFGDRPPRDGAPRPFGDRPPRDAAPRTPSAAPGGAPIGAPSGESSENKS